MQVLVDDERFRRLEAEAAAAGSSVASVVRKAIDEHFLVNRDSRAEAGRQLMAEFGDSDDATEPDWAESKAALMRDLDVKLP
ncbi:hypothetical protein SAMN04488554_2957 [Ruania alba]|uniref:Ribbon-helix-helix protein CopG domain-containing protein n=2 Tax=Ruania alba TaxID=648782 RepID=A0A1H5LUA7_9MICO|nr:hypothetical protein SAMN04488554_2957 [Ruania alba]